MKNELVILKIPIRQCHEYHPGKVVEVDGKNFSIVRVRKVGYELYPCERHYVLCSAREVELVDLPF